MLRNIILQHLTRSVQLIHQKYVTDVKSQHDQVKNINLNAIYLNAAKLLYFMTKRDEFADYQYRLDMHFYRC